MLEKRHSSDYAVVKARNREDLRARAAWLQELAVMLSDRSEAEQARRLAVRLREEADALERRSRDLNPASASVRRSA
jgi:hypothetical protein